MFIMLDISGSMLDLTDSGTSKWDAVKSALEAFVQDERSAGLGVGIQYFPIQKPDAPESCTSNAECGDSGPCFLNLCWNYDLGLVQCENDDECGMFGPCLPFAVCENDESYVCNSVGDPCGEDPPGTDLGTCLLVQPSFCMHTSNCEVSVYEAPAVEIGTLPDAAPALLDSIGAQEPTGTTPTAPALTGAINAARNWAIAHPDHRVTTVLATDGLPTECDPIEITDVADIARAGKNGDPSVPTFVIGVFGPNDIDSQSNIDDIATAGGESAFIVDTSLDVTQQFLDALDAIRGARLACEFQIPTPDAGGTLNYNAVNVEFTHGGTSELLFYVGSADACDPASGGWYYDNDPAVSAPTKIVACPASCDAFTMDDLTEASVQIALGCTTVVR
jgi:hypothetical protein